MAEIGKRVLSFMGRRMRVLVEGKKGLLVPCCCLVLLEVVPAEVGAAVPVKAAFVIVVASEGLMVAVAWHPNS